jgi:penicillin-binding protein 1A
MRLLLRFLGFLFAVGAILFVCGAVGATWMIWQYQKDLPDYSALQDYEPPVMTRVHATGGSIFRFRQCPRS